MPFREFFRRRGAAHPGIYSSVTLALGVIRRMVVRAVVSVVVSVLASEEAREQERATDRHSAERQRYAVCITANRVIKDVYNDPESETAKKARQAGSDLRRTFHCDGTELVPKD